MKLETRGYTDCPTSYFSSYSAKWRICRYLERMTYHAPPCSFYSAPTWSKVVHTSVGAAPQRAWLLDTLLSSSGPAPTLHCMSGAAVAKWSIRRLSTSQQAGIFGTFALPGCSHNGCRCLSASRSFFARVSRSAWLLQACDNG